MKKEQVLVNPDEVVKQFNEADELGKEILKKFFPQFLPKKITDIIKSFEDACEYLKQEAFILDFSKLPVKDQKYHIANIKLVAIVRALNEGWEPNWDNDNERKYIIWFNMRTSDFGLCYVLRCRDSDVSSRLCFRNSELARYCFDQFEALWRDLMLIEK